MAESREKSPGPNGALRMLGDEIEITPEMIEVGTKLLLSWDYEQEAAQVVAERLFREMLIASPKHQSL